MSIFFNQIFDFDGLAECIVMMWMMTRIFEKKHSRETTIGIGAVVLVLYTVLNSCVIAANELLCLFTAQIRFVLYVVLIVFAGLFFAMIALKGFYQQFFVTLLFFKTCVLFASFLYKTNSAGWTAWIQNDIAKNIVIEVIGVVIMLLAGEVCVRMSRPIRSPLSLLFWIVASLIPICLIALWTVISQVMQENAFLINFIMLLISALSYILFIRLAGEMEKQMDLQLKNQTLDFQIRQIDDAQIMLEQTRAARHELKNNYFYLETLLKQQKYSEMQDFLDQVIWPGFQRQEMVSTGNRLVDMILSQKVMEARQQNIPIVLDVNVPAELKIQKQMLCSLLFNLLDNAIEASLKIESPDIYFVMAEKKGYLSIEVRNKIEESVLNKNPKLHTSKSNPAGHGIGVKIIRQIVDYCDGNISFSEGKGCFIAEIMLPDR